MIWVKSNGLFINGSNVIVPIFAYSANIEKDVNTTEK